MKQFQKEQLVSRIFRVLVLVLILAGNTVISILHLYSKMEKPIGVDALCPFGGIEAFLILIINGSIVQRIAWSSFIILLSVFIIGSIFFRSFCGNICPLGFLQELSGYIGKLFFKKKRLQISSGIDKPLRCLKYIVLVVAIVLSFLTNSLIIRPYDPWVAYNHISSTDLFAEFSIGFSILVFSLIASFFFERVFCKYLCPN